MAGPDLPPCDGIPVQTAWRLTPEAGTGFCCAYLRSGQDHAQSSKNVLCGAAAQAADPLPVEYFHVVFTLPAEIAQIAYWNKKAV